MSTKIGFWDEQIRPVATTEPYLDGFVEKIKEWETSLRTYRCMFTQRLVGGEIVSYMGYSHCRLCDFPTNGYHEITYLGYTFPIGYFHYIFEHHIYVPIAFQEYVLSSEVPEVVDKTEREIKRENAVNLLRFMGGIAGVKYS